MLFDPSAHERLTERPWAEPAARAAIAAIAADAESSFDAVRLWPAHPLDDIVHPAPLAGVYLGAAGVVWALDRLARLGAAEKRDWAAVAAALPERYDARPDFEEEYGGPIPSLWFGQAGPLLVAWLLASGDGFGPRLLETVRDNEQNPACDLAWGSPGTMLAAQALWERTGDEAWADAWQAAAEWLLSEWREELWEQQIAGRRYHVLGPAHGFAGNVLVLARGELLPPDRRRDLERRAVAVVTRHAVWEDGLAQWPPSVEEAGMPAKTRTQWCHGAPGIVTSLALLAPHDDDFTALLGAGGELTWVAGPHVKGPGLCHGTAGNGYAFLKLFERTGEERWLERARGFAMHAIEQVDRARRRYGQGRYSLMTGDVGTALYLRACIDVDAAFPTIDVF